jgi:hypothetical protein
MGLNLKFVEIHPRIRTSEQDNRNKCANLRYKVKLTYYIG